LIVGSGGEKGGEYGGAVVGADDHPYPSCSCKALGPLPPRRRGFDVLADKQADFDAGSSTSPYCRAYKLDDAGSGMMVDLIKSTGVCGDCNEDRTGEHVNAFCAMVKGMVSTPATETLPAVIAVTSVKPASDGIGCSKSGSSILKACIAERSDLVDGQAP